MHGLRSPSHVTALQFHGQMQYRAWVKAVYLNPWAPQVSLVTPGHSWSGMQNPHMSQAETLQRAATGLHGDNQKGKGKSRDSFNPSFLSEG